MDKKWGNVVRLVVTGVLALAVLLGRPGLGAASGTMPSSKATVSSLSVHPRPMTNGVIAFIAGYANASLNAIDPTSGRLRILAGCTTTRCFIGDYVWSNDGKRIAFVRSRGDAQNRNVSGSFSVSVTNANGRGEKRLAGSAGRYGCRGLAWAPDGVHLVCSRETWLRPFPSYRASLYVLNTKTGGFRQLTHCPSHFVCTDMSPSWSPDGKKIVFGRSPTACGHGCGSALLYIMNADGSGLRKLSNFFGSGGEPAWSPDGGSVAFATYRGIFTVSPNGSHLRMLAANGGKVCSPYVGLMNTPGLQPWSPDGTHLLYAKTTIKITNPKAVSTVDCGKETTALWVTNADGGGQRRLFAAANVGFSATWSPDGKRIAFAANFFPDKHAKSGLYLMDANGTHLHRLLAGTLPGLAWQPVP